MSPSPKLADRILQAVRRRGSNAVDVRDAAHEASHALHLNICKGQWDRETIHKAVLDLSLTERAMTEILARAVEAEICQLCGEKYDQQYFLMLAVMEAIKGAGLRLPLGLTSLVNQARTNDFRVSLLVKEICNLEP